MQYDLSIHPSIIPSFSLSVAVCYHCPGLRGFCCEHRSKMNPHVVCGAHRRQAIHKQTPHALEGKISREGVGRDGAYGDISEEKTLN